MLIGIAGPKRSGKDTLANGLSDLLHIPRDSFAGPMRRFVADLLGWTLEELELRKEEPIPWLDDKLGAITARHLLQTVGTEWGRMMIHPELWLRSLMQRADVNGAIISDVRFENEARLILDMGGVVIQLSRPGAGTSGDHHVSEVPLRAELVSITLANDGTPRQLIQHALDFLGRVPHG